MKKESGKILVWALLIPILFYILMVIFLFVAVSLEDAHAEPVKKYFHVNLILDRVVSGDADQLTKKNIRDAITFTKESFKTGLGVILTVKLIETRDDSFALHFENELYKYMMDRYDWRKTFSPADVFHIVTPPLSWDASVGGPPNPYKYVAGVSLVKVKYEGDQSTVDLCLVGDNSVSINDGLKSDDRLLSRYSYVYLSKVAVAHEVAHQMGAMHIPDTRQIMNPLVASLLDPYQQGKIKENLKFSGKSRAQVEACLLRKGYEKY